jgi:hypothetical protein
MSIEKMVDQAFKDAIRKGYDCIMLQQGTKRNL